MGSNLLALDTKVQRPMSRALDPIRESAGERATRLPIRTEALANFKLALPIIATQLGTMLMGLVDTAIVGRAGERELAGVAIGNVLSFAVTIPAVGLLIAIEPLASQAIGAGDAPRARATLREGVRLSLLLTLPFMALSYASVLLLAPLKVDPAVIPLARAYVVARLLSVLPYFLYMTGKTYQQAVMRPRASVEAVVIANVVNAIASYVAVFGDKGLLRIGLPAIGLPAFGGAGAGAATTISMALMAFWLLVVRGKIPAGAADAARAGEVAGGTSELRRKMLRLGVPIGLQLGAEVGIFSLVTVLMGRLGGRAAASHQIALGLASFSFMGALGIAQSTSVRVGLSVGAATGGARRAGMIGIGMGICAMATWSLVFALAPTMLARLFSPESPVIDAAVPLIRIAALFQLFDGAQVVAAGALRGAGDTRWPLIANVVVHWLIALPLALLFGFRWGMGARGLWFGLTAGLVCVGTVLVGRFWVLSGRAIVRV